MAKISAQAEKLGWKFLGKNLGKGGQGDVELVERTTEPGGTRYAFKVLGERGGERAFERFRRELETLQKIDHPGIVKVIDFAKTDDDLQFYVMEYVEDATSLRKRMDQTSNLFFQNPLRALEAYIQIVEALAECEKLDIVHRDLSPANIMITDNGRVMLIDFGLCQIEDGDRITLAEEAVGTPHYRPPECSGYADKPVSIKADLYSAGKILWSMITNKVAFDREKPVFNQLSLSKVLPTHEMAWHLYHIFAKTIRHNPDSRYANAAAALYHAREIREVIRAHKPPLEMLDGKVICPVCGIGDVVHAGWLLENKLICHGVVQHGIVDPVAQRDYQSVSVDARQLWSGQKVCTYCGFTCFWWNHVSKVNLKYRETLE